MFCSPNALLYRKIPTCPKTFGHDCSLDEHSIALPCSSVGIQFNVLTSYLKELRYDDILSCFPHCAK